MKIKIPNYLTIGRIIIVPIFAFTYYLPGFYGDVLPFALFVIASFTDFLDGLLARMFKEESKLGELLDPIADKIIIATALILLVMDGTIQNYEVIAAIIILTREILISGLREFLAKGKIKLPVSNLAKLKTFCFCHECYQNMNFDFCGVGSQSVAVVASVGRRRLVEVEGGWKPLPQKLKFRLWPRMRPNFDVFFFQIRFTIEIIIPFHTI